MKIYLFLLLGLIAAAFLPPKNATILQGKITGENGEVLIGASVKALKGKYFVKGAISDDNGAYRLELDPGTYDVEVSYSGYITARIIGVIVLLNQANYLHFTLTAKRAANDPTALVQQDTPPGDHALRNEQIRDLAARKVAPDTAKTVEKVLKDADEINIKGLRAIGYDPQMKDIRITGAPPPVMDIVNHNNGDTVPPPTTGIPARRFYSVAPLASTLTRDTSHASIRENPFLETKTNATSTFSVDVDGPSYCCARSMLWCFGILPAPDDVQIEEFINSFDYDYPAPKSGEVFSIHTELAQCPWNSQNRLLLVGLQGRRLEKEQLPPGNFVFLVDVSQSMYAANKLRLVALALAHLAEQLRPQDRMALVVYGSAKGLVLPSTPGSDKQNIKAAIGQMTRPVTATRLAGIRQACAIARANFIRGGNNRVVLCTDGDLNLGPGGEQKLIKYIEKERKKGIFFSTLGFGTGKYQEQKMQRLATIGNGNHAYIDRLSEARVAMIREFSGASFSIARDVNIQVGFNPAKVAAYRLIGFDNALPAGENANETTTGSGDLAPGHQVTALYEIVPNDLALPPGAETSEIRYPETQLIPVVPGYDELASIQLRYKPSRPDAASQLIETAVTGQPTVIPSNNFLVASALAEFGLLLRHSAYSRTPSYEKCLGRARKADQNNPSKHLGELCDLIALAQLKADSHWRRR